VVGGEISRPDEKHRRAAGPETNDLGDGGFDVAGVPTARQAFQEPRGFEPSGAGLCLESGIRVSARSAEQPGVHLPEPALVIGAPCGFVRARRPRMNFRDGEIAKDVAYPARLDQIASNLRHGGREVPDAERALVVGKLDQRDPGRLGAERGSARQVDDRHLPQVRHVPRELLLTRSKSTKLQAGVQPESGGDDHAGDGNDQVPTDGWLARGRGGWLPHHGR
jgi:hypothetical protein